jgi:hypothetical protein
MKPEKELWVEEVLASTDKINRAVSPPALYAHTIKRIANASNLNGAYILRIAAGVAILVSVNVFACAFFLNSKAERENGSLQAFAKEFSITPGVDNF